MAQIEVRHLTKIFTSKDAKVDALKDISLEIELPGEADQRSGSGRRQGIGGDVREGASEAA